MSSDVRQLKSSFVRAFNVPGAPTSSSAHNSGNNPASNNPRQATSIVASAPTSYAESLLHHKSFYFQQRRGSLDLRSISRCDVERVIREVDIDTLQSFLENITFSDLNQDELSLYSDESFVRLFQITQLTLEYLLNVQDTLASNLDSLAQKYSKKKRELERTKQGVLERDEEIEKLKRENRRKRKTIMAYEAMLRQAPPAKETEKGACLRAGEIVLHLRPFQCPFQCPFCLSFVHFVRIYYTFILQRRTSEFLPPRGLLCSYSRFHSSVRRLPCRRHRCCLASSAASSVSAAIRKPSQSFSSNPYFYASSSLPPNLELSSSSKKMTAGKPTDELHIYVIRWFIGTCIDVTVFGATTVLEFKAKLQQLTGSTMPLGEHHVALKGTQLKDGDRLCDVGVGDESVLVLMDGTATKSEPAAAPASAVQQVRERQVICFLLFVVCCLLFVVCCLLFVVCRLSPFSS